MRVLVLVRAFVWLQVVTTYPMIAYGGKRSAQSGRAMAEIKQIEWGLVCLPTAQLHPVEVVPSMRVLVV